MLVPAHTLPAWTGKITTKLISTYTHLYCSAKQRKNKIEQQNNQLT